MSDSGLTAGSQRVGGSGIGKRTSPVVGPLYPLVLALWENGDFSGVRRTIVENTIDMTSQSFGRVAAIGVHPGPDYERWKEINDGKEPTVGVYQQINYAGAALILTKGAYANIASLSSISSIANKFAQSAFGQTVGSVRFDPPPPSLSAPPAPPITYIPLIVTIYEHGNFQGRSAVIIEDVNQLSSYLGSSFNDLISSVRVKAGPNYAEGKKAQLFRDTNFLGGSIQLDIGDYPSLSASHSFNDTTSSIKVS